MKKILDALKIDETYTKPIKKSKKFTKVKDVTLPVEHFNYMADVLFLPTTKEGYKDCLSIVDLGNDEFDIEPMKDKEAATVLESMKKIFCS